MRIKTNKQQLSGDLQQKEDAMNDYNEDDYQESGKIRDQKRKERET